MQELTARQQQCLEFIRIRVEQNGYPPTMHEIGAHMGIRSTNAVNDHLVALQRKGYLKRTPNISRGLDFTVAGFVATSDVMHGFQFIAPKVCEKRICGATYFGEKCPCAKRFL